jgi:hypothetical protein
VTIFQILKKEVPIDTPVRILIANRNDLSGSILEYYDNAIKFRDKSGTILFLSQSALEGFVALPDGGQDIQATPEQNQDIAQQTAELTNVLKTGDDTGGERVASVYTESPSSPPVLPASIPAIDLLEMDDLEKDEIDRTIALVPSDLNISTPYRSEMGEVDDTVDSIPGDEPEYFDRPPSPDLTGQISDLQDEIDLVECVSDGGLGGGNAASRDETNEPMVGEESIILDGTPQENGFAPDLVSQEMVSKTKKSKSRLKNKNRRESRGVIARKGVVTPGLGFVQSESEEVKKTITPAVTTVLHPPVQSEIKQGVSVEKELEVNKKQVKEYQKLVDQMDRQILHSRISRKSFIFRPEELSVEGPVKMELKPLFSHLDTISDEYAKYDEKWNLFQITQQLERLLEIFPNTGVIEYNIGCLALDKQDANRAIPQFEKAYRSLRIPGALFNIVVANRFIDIKFKGYVAAYEYFKSVPPIEAVEIWYNFLQYAKSEGNYSLVFETIERYLGASPKGTAAQTDTSLTVEPSLALYTRSLLWIFAQQRDVRYSEALYQMITSSDEECWRQLVLSTLMDVQNEYRVNNPELSERYQVYLSNLHKPIQTCEPGPIQKRASPLGSDSTGVIYDFIPYPKGYGFIRNIKGKQFFFHLNYVNDPELHIDLSSFDTRHPIEVDFTIEPPQEGKLYEVAKNVRFHEYIVPASKAKPKKAPQSGIFAPVESDQAELDNSRISLFSAFYLDNCVLDSVRVTRIKKTGDQKVCYCGNSSQAQDDIESIERIIKSSTKGRKTPYFRATQLLSAAKIAYDAQLGIEKVYHHLARSFSSRGDAHLYDDKVHPDAAMACYLESLKLFDRTRIKGIEEPRNILAKYLLILGKQTRIEPSPDLSPDTAIKELFESSSFDPNRIFEHLTILTKNSRIAKGIILKYIHHNKRIFAQSLNFITSRGGITLTQAISYDEFVTHWEAIQRKKNDSFKTLSRNLEELTQTTLTGARIEADIQRIEHSKSGLIYTLDQTRIFDFTRSILAKITKFFKERVFEEKESALKEAGINIDRIKAEVNESPTQFCIRCLLPLLSHLHDTVDKHLEELYSSSAPNLTLRLPGEKDFLIPDTDLITVPIIIENATYCSPVEKLHLIVHPSPEYYTIQETNLNITESLVGGRQVSIPLVLKITNLTQLEMTFTLPIVIHYEYRSFGPSLQRAESEPYNIPIRLYKKEDFQKILNPYAFGGAVENIRMFYGRDVMIDEIISNLLEVPQNKGVVIFGQKRSGKSSVLFHAALRLKDMPHVIAVNIRSIGDALEYTSEFSLLDHILWKIIDYLKKEVDKVAVSSERRPLTTKFPSLEEFSSSKVPSLLFNQIFERISQEFEESVDWRGTLIVILIDEFTYIYEQILKGRLPMEFMKMWKALLEKNYFKVILAGQDVMPRFKNKFSNEFAMLADQKVTYLLPEFAKKLIEYPILVQVNGQQRSRYRENSVAEIINLTACSPYYIQIFCNRLVDVLNREYSIYVIDHHIKKVKEELISGANALSLDKFENLYNSGDISEDAISNGDALAVLQDIADNSYNGSCHISKISRSSTDKPIETILDDLVSRDVIVRESRAEGEYYRIKVNLFKEYLSKNPFSNKPNITSSENPFSSFGKQVYGEAFIGRRHTIQDIENQVIDTRQTTNLSIIGLPRMGKTSLIKEILRRHASLLQQNQRIPIYIDISRLNSPYELFYEMARSSNEKIQEISQDERLKSLLLKTLDKKNGEFFFTNALRDFFLGVKQTGFFLIYFLDEFDKVSKIFQNFPNGLQIIRELASSPSEYPVCLVTLQRRTMNDLEKQINKDEKVLSTLSGIFHSLYLSGFDEDDRQEFFQTLSQSEVAMSEEEKRYLLKKCGNFPYYLTATSYYLIKQMQKSHTINIDDAISHVRTDLYANFDHILRLLDESELLPTLYRIIQRPDEEVRSTAILGLKQYGIIETKNRQHVITSDLFREYLEEKNEEMTRSSREFVKEPEFDLLIEGSESPSIEFKASAFWTTFLSPEDIEREITSRDQNDFIVRCLTTYQSECAPFIVAKAIAAFLNANGGNLIIGIRESDHFAQANRVYGINNDLERIFPMTTDAYVRKIDFEVMKKFFNYSLTQELLVNNTIQIDFPKKGSKIFCWIKIRPSDKPVYVNDNEFYVRSGQKVIMMKPYEVHDYWAKRTVAK